MGLRQHVRMKQWMEMAKNKWNGWKLQEMPVKDWNGLNWLELAQYGSEWLKSAKHGLADF